jgi:hypothetical protein
MTYCGMWEHMNRDGTTIWVHEWVRVTEIEPFGLRFETYTFGTYRKCLPLPKETI